MQGSCAPVRRCVVQCRHFPPSCIFVLPCARGSVEFGIGNPCLVSSRILRPPCTRRRHSSETRVARSDNFFSASCFADAIAANSHHPAFAQSGVIKRCSRRLEIHLPPGFPSGGSGCDLVCHIMDGGGEGTGASRIAFLPLVTWVPPLRSHSVAFGASPR